MLKPSERTQNFYHLHSSSHLKMNDIFTECRPSVKQTPSCSHQFLIILHLLVLQWFFREQSHKVKASNINAACSFLLVSCKLHLCESFSSKLRDVFKAKYLLKLQYYSPFGRNCLPCSAVNSVLKVRYSIERKLVNGLCITWKILCFFCCWFNLMVICFTAFIYQNNFSV